LLGPILDDREAKRRPPLDHPPEKGVYITMHDQEY